MAWSHGFCQWLVAVPRYLGSQLFRVLGDGVELEEIYRHDQQVLQGMFNVMVRQQGVMAVTWQSRAVVFQWLYIEASMRHDQGQRRAQVDITGSESSQNMVCWWCENLVAAELKVGAEADLLGFSGV